MADATLQAQPIPHLESQRQMSQRRRAFQRLVRNPTTILGLGLVLLAIAVAILAPLIAPYDPIYGNLRDHLQPPSLVHAFGTDDVGRDILTRTIFGAQISLQIGIVVQIITLLVG